MTRRKRLFGPGDRPGWVVLTAMAVCPLVNSPWLKDGLSTSRELFFIFLTGVSLCLYALQVAGRKGRMPARWTAIDKLSCLSLLYSIGNALAHSPAGSPIPLHLLIQVSTLAYYLLLSRWLAGRGKRTVLIGRLLPAMTLVQLVIGGLQYAGVLTSHHYAFPVTGPFFNPAPYAIYLAALAIASFPFLPGFRKTAKGYGLLAAAVCCLGLLLLLQSRSAWMGAIGGMVFLILVQRKKEPFLLFRRLRKFVIPAVLLSLPLLAAGGYLLYRMKADSATGRLLTWTVSGQLIRDHFLTGVGEGNFAPFYGQYQHAFFSSDAERARYGALAGDVRYAFNDELQLTAEDGIIGLVLRIMLVLSVLTVARRGQTKTVMAAGGGLVVLLIAGVFSYPMTQLPVNLLFWTFCAMLSSGASAPSNPELPGPSAGLVRIGILALTLPAGVFLCYEGAEKTRAMKKWKGLDKERPAPGETYQGKYAALYPLLADNGHFLLDYAGACATDGNYRKAIAILESAKTRTPDPGLYYNLGEAYEATGSYAFALQHYGYVAITLPGLLRPHYLITRLYYRKGDQKAFRRAAMEALRFSPKIITADTEKMKEDIRLWLRLDQLPE